MRKLITGILVGFGSALFITTLASRHLLLRCLGSRYPIAGEAKVAEAAQTASCLGTVLRILLLIGGLGMDLFLRRI